MKFGFLLVAIMHAWWYFYRKYLELHNIELTFHTE